MKFVYDTANTNANPANTAGSLSGTVTRKNVPVRLAPRFSDACSSRRSRSASSAPAASRS